MRFSEILTEAEQLKLKSYYNSVFSSAAGRIVFQHMLFELGYFRHNTFNDPVIQVRRDYAADLILYVGGKDADLLAERIVSAVLRVGEETEGITEAEKEPENAD